ncbi:MAG TPA: hypoxanthine-guanine phosphoribosyltransferase [Burkholderiales bacterium]|nr:hypoxanthine-guanine phosphoribosyltransferase [Burkholderiales bacterium]
MPDAGAAWAFLERSELVASAEEVQSAVRRLAGEIGRALGERYPLVLVVMGGAVVFAGQILPLLRFPLDFDYVHASRYGVQTRGAELEWRVRPPELVKGRTVLVLDDILDHGETMNAIRKGLLDRGAQSVYAAVLVEKNLQIRKPASADFVGLRIPDRFVFGCGMDAEGFWRNLPEIRALRQ